jgi:hypothetical protein
MMIYMNIDSMLAREHGEAMLTRSPVAKIRRTREATQFEIGFRCVRPAEKSAPALAFAIPTQGARLVRR